MTMRQDTAKQYRLIRKLLKGSEPIAEAGSEPLTRPGTLHNALMLSGCLILSAIFLLCFMGGCAHAQEININKIANAIYFTEGGIKTNWPYGIKHHYKHTTPRQACINTIKHQLRDWDGQGDFITFLGETYSPPDINPNWVRLVHYFLERTK